MRVSASYRLIGALVLTGLHLFLPTTLCAEGQYQYLYGEYCKKKAVVIRHGAQLYDESGSSLGKARFLNIYFLLGDASGRAIERDGRVPVARRENNAELAGWIEKAAFAPWNTAELIDFADQSGRPPVKVFQDHHCALMYGMNGESTSVCPDLGEEPMGQRRKETLFILPVYDSRQGNVTTYQAGFVRVAGGQARGVVPSSTSTPPTRKFSAASLDVVFVIDSTGSMSDFFRPTADAVSDFAKHLQVQFGDGEIKNKVRFGLLYYRDRKMNQDCDIEYLTKWPVHLESGNFEKLATSLRGESRAPCGSDDVAEAVHDGLVRVIEESDWAPDSFKVIVLVGDAPAHEPGSRNPFNYSTEGTGQKAWEKNIRIVSVKVNSDGSEDNDDGTAVTQFRVLSEGSGAESRGRSSVVPYSSDQNEYRANLTRTLLAEWQMVAKASNLLEVAIKTGTPLPRLPTTPGAALPPRPLDISEYEWPIILSNLPPDPTGGDLPEHVAAWAPKKIRDRQALREFIFARKSTLKKLSNALESFGLAARDGQRDGAENFIISTRTVLANLYAERPEDYFKPGETLTRTMKRAFGLPFRTALTSFSPEEVQNWGSAKYEEVANLFEEKQRKLDAFIDVPGNQHVFDREIYYYVPREVFP
jgi:hypothetical protein